MMDPIRYLSARPRIGSGMRPLGQVGTKLGTGQGQTARRGAGPLGAGQARCGRGGTARVRRGCGAVRLRGCGAAVRCGAGPETPSKGKGIAP